MTGIAASYALTHLLRGPESMAIFGFMDTRELEEFASTLAADLARRFPPASEARTDPGAERQFKIILEGLATRAVRYHEQNRLGVYRKAKLGNVFRWKLKELGYSNEFVEHATEVIVKRLAVK